MDELHPVDRSALERLHRSQWIAQHDKHAEYGRVLNAWMKARGDGIMQDWYLARIDSARRLDAVSNEWARLDLLFAPVRDDLEIFRHVVGLEADQVALDRHGYWYVSSTSLAGIAATQIEKERRKQSVLKNWVIVLIAMVAFGALSRCG